jgi:hypothetical protein
MAATNPFGGASCGLKTNDNGEQYQHGRSYDKLKKFEIALRTSLYGDDGLDKESVVS